MDIVYASLRRRPTAPVHVTGEVAEVLGILWAHARPDDGLEHICGAPVHDRLDLLLYLLPSAAVGSAAPDSVRRTVALLARCHLASPTLRRRYLPPLDTTGREAEEPGSSPS
ncbi:hypothetical protein ACFW1A_09220 [Kitasatospora sp. NPDC058965]|uniref:hypothetical protein n=1 Tax=Kitasatospora sp. NPDC058965 TaxID=3346682 RepID=UPI003689A0DC